MIKIVIDGIHGAGKTTLINNIKNFLESIDKNFYVIKEVARKCPYPLETIKSQRWIWNAHKKEEKKIVFNGHINNINFILYDRSLLSNLLYYKYLLNGKNDFIFNKMWDYTKKWMQLYNHISVLPMNPEFIVDDGFRIIDMNKTIEINKLFIKYLKPYQNIDINRFNYEEVIMEILNG